MFKLPLTSNKVSIAKKSIGNFVVQDSNINNLVVCNGTPDLIKTMGDIQQYDAIQRIISDCMSAAKLTHPLRPHFTAKYNSQLEKLVSTPETEDAFKIYPKKIKGTFLLDYKKYPHMDGAETPWESAQPAVVPCWKKGCRCFFRAPGKPTRSRCKSPRK